jgi:hypothetical protein
MPFVPTADGSFGSGCDKIAVVLAGILDPDHYRRRGVLRLRVAPNDPAVRLA